MRRRKSSRLCPSFSLSPLFSFPSFQLPFVLLLIFLLFLLSYSSILRKKGQWGKLILGREAKKNR
jgi:hypothetical protein